MLKAEELSSNNIYDKLAGSYEMRIDATYTQFLKYKLLERFTKRSDICLDVGIGNGIFSIPLSGRVKEIHGVEISPKMLEECRKNIAKAGSGNIYLYERSAADLPFENAFFDTVFSYSTLLLVRRIDVALKEIVRVLKPGAIAVLDITNRCNLSQRYWNKYYVVRGHWGIHSFGLREVERKFRGLGMEVIERHATGFLDQWKYIWGLNWLGRRFLEKLFHSTPRCADLDYKASQKVSHLANRWYFVVKKETAREFPKG